MFEFYYFGLTFCPDKMIILNNSTKVNKIVQIILRSSTNLNYTELIEKLQNKVNTRITDREMMLAFGEITISNYK